MWMSRVLRQRPRVGEGEINFGCDPFGLDVTHLRWKAQGWWFWYALVLFEL